MNRQEIGAFIERSVKERYELSEIQYEERNSLENKHKKDSRTLFKKQEEELIAGGVSVENERDFIILTVVTKFEMGDMYEGD